MNQPPLSSRELYFRLLGYVRPYWRMFALAIFGMVATAATEPVFPALMKPLLDNNFSGKNPDSLYLIPVFLIGLFLLRGVLTYISSYALAWVSNKVVMDMRNALFARLVQLPTRYYDNQSSGMLISKIASDVSGVTMAATSVLTVVVRDTLTIVGLLGWLMYLNWKLTLITFLIIPFITLAVSVFSKRLRSMSRESMRAMGDITHILEETIECHKVVKIFGGQEYESKRFGQANAALRGFNMRQTIAASATVPIVQLFAAIALAIVITLALMQSASGETTVGGFVSFITAMLMLLTPLKHLTDINSPLQRGLASAESVFELLDEPPESDGGQTDIGRAQGELRFDNVTFQYPETSRPALARINLTIHPGETVALVGASGSGKTTLANLLPHFYRPDSGCILVDGQDIESLTLASLRRNIALVSQDVVLFNDTIAANIAYGAMCGAAEADIIAAAEAAHAMEYIREMPDGLNTMIGENGVRLSGGQRQRLAIARAILKNTPILVLDEATSALDTHSEKHVQAALDNLMQNRTTLVIAHRLSTIEKADRIVVLQKGRIAEIGNHAELLAHDGIYANLYKIQYALEADGS